MGNIYNHLCSLEAAPDHKYSFVSNRNEEPSDSHNDSGIDEFSSPLSPGDNVTITVHVDDVYDWNSSALPGNQTGAYASSTSSLAEMTESTTPENTSDDLEIDPDDIQITIAILKALNLVDQMNGSISDFEDVLQFAKELHCRKDSHLEEKWPGNWQETQTVL